MKTRARTTLLVVAVALVAAACWKTRPNPLYCDDTVACNSDPTRPFCDTATHECIAIGDLGADLGPDLAKMCTSSTTCTSGSARFCDATSGTCRACMASDCASPSGVCATSGPLSGACVECVDEGPCMAAQKTCDAASGTCVACSKHSECGSGICDAGKCVKATDIAYVDNQHTGCASGDGSQANPLCEVNPAIATMKAYVRVAGSATSYAQIAVMSASNVTVTIVGPGKSASLTARFKPASAVAALIQPAGGTTKVVLDGLELIGESTPAHAGVSCSGAGGTADLTVRDCYVHASGGVGISSDTCTLTLAQNFVANNQGGGVTVTSGSYDIQNNLIYLNTATNAPGVTIGASTSGTFRFNTVAKNNNSGGGSGGMNCVSSAQVLDSIIFANTVAAAQVTGCTLVRTATGGTDGVTGDFATPPTFVDPLTDFHLKPGSDPNNKLCCVDKAASTGSPPSVDVDNTKRPKGGGYDVGAHEVE
jgi:hypothetical protein